MFSRYSAGGAADCTMSLLTMAQSQPITYDDLLQKALYHIEQIGRGCRRIPCGR